MGPSGSGKTTLLECISLRNRGFEGAVHYDGKPCDGGFFQASAFVHQKELLYGYLTPREHLTFHAFTRMSREYSREALLARVEEVGVWESCMCCGGRASKSIHWTHTFTTIPPTR